MVYYLDLPIVKLKRRIESIKNSKLGKEKIDDLLKFHEDIALVERLKPQTSERRIANMQHLGAMIEKPFRNWNKDDIRKVVLYIQSKPEWGEYTKKDYKSSLRKFFKWLRNTEEYPEEVRWIKTNPPGNYHRRLPEEILTEDEIKRMYDAADNHRDKALVSVIYQSGCRIGEILSLRLKHIQFDEYGALLLVNGKTGQRRVRIIETSPLAKWLEIHPFKDDPESVLWITKYGRSRMISKNGVKYFPFDYAGVRDMLSELAKRCGIKKRVNPHSFRHARATHLANKLTEAQMKEYFGWTQGSKMASIYVHLSGRDVDKAILEAYGIKKNDEQELKSKMMNCLRCQEKNDSLSLFCKRCGTPLTLETAIEILPKIEEKQKEKGDVTALVLEKILEKLRLHLNVDEMVRQTIKELKVEEKFEKI
jgi:integrase